MQRLHLVGFTSELDGLIFSTRTGARSGGYVVTLDDELLDAIRDVLQRRDGGVAARPLRPTAAVAPVVRAVLGGPAGRPHPVAGQTGSALTPREIQARLRAGRSIEDVAIEAGVDDEWVRRFATPVFAEQAHVVARALAEVLESEHDGRSAEALGEAVATNLALRGAALTDDERATGWSAFQVRDSAWAVQFHAIVRGRELRAQWGYDVRARTLVALNRLAGELAWVDGGRAKPSAFAGVTEQADGAEAPGLPAAADPAGGAEAPNLPAAADPAAGAHRAGAPRRSDASTLFPVAEPEAEGPAGSVPPADGEPGPAAAARPRRRRAAPAG